jgi:hypothetical protein
LAHSAKPRGWGRRLGDKQTPSGTVHRRSDCAAKRRPRKLRISGDNCWIRASAK